MHAKDCRCVQCLVMHNAEPCTKRLSCPAPNGHAGPCVGVLGHVRLIKEAVSHDLKAWLRRVSQ
jgi:hypothetical protein